MLVVPHKGISSTVSSLFKFLKIFFVSSLTDCGMSWNRVAFPLWSESFPVFTIYIIINTCSIPLVFWWIFKLRLFVNVSSIDINFIIIIIIFWTRFFDIYFRSFYRDFLYGLSFQILEILRQISF